MTERSRGRGSALTRVVQLYRALADHPMTIDQIQADLGVCRRSAYNYLTAIEDAGARLINEPDPEGLHPANTRWRMLLG